MSEITKYPESVIKKLLLETIKSHGIEIKELIDYSCILEDKVRLVYKAQYREFNSQLGVNVRTTEYFDLKKDFLDLELRMLNAQTKK